MNTVHIIGAGMAGLAAAIKLAEAGYRVHLYDAAGQPGGRCRSYRDESLGRVIDNGNHILLHANTHAMEYIRLIGAQHRFTRHAPSFSMVDAASDTHFTLAYPFISIPGAKFHEYIGLFRLLAANVTSTVEECFGTHSALFRRFIDPFSTAVLNTASDEASAACLRRIMLSLLAGGKQGWSYYLPLNSLADALIDRALHFIALEGGQIHLHHALKKLERDEHHVTALHFAERTAAIAPDDAVILTMQELEPFIPGTTSPGYNAIVNAHFCYDMPGNTSFTGILGGTAQWVMARDGIISTTTSAANHLLGTEETQLAKLLWDDCCRALKLPPQPIPPYRIIKEKRATFAATPDNLAQRPQPRTEWENLLLAGDGTDTGLPGTIEGAILSGFRAADMLKNRQSTSKSYLSTSKNIA